MTHLITVDPFGDGWSVRTSETIDPMLFLSGAAAETSARRLGEILAQRGDGVEVEIRLRNGVLAGRFVYPSRGESRLVLEAV